MITNRIFSYYADIGWTGQDAVIELWKEKWQAQGWEPIMLGEDDAKADPRFEAMMLKAETLPSIPGMIGFQRVNFKRWLAFSRIEGVAAVADYDVFPIRHFPPKDFGQLPFCADGSGGPGFIVGTGRDFSDVADAILNYQPQPDDVWEGQKHVSEMSIIWKHSKGRFHIDVLIITHGHENFGTVPLAHYGNHSLVGITNHFKDMSKADAIRKMLAEHYH